ncbi:MAG: alpha/beta fold hydrolase, partial [Bacteroidota bacterium]
QQLYGQVPDQQLVGSWTGALDVGTVKLRLAFNLSLTGEGQFSATLDSPDQGAMGIPLGEVNRWGDSIKIDAPALMGYYTGKVSSETTMEGVWNQNNQGFQLDLEKQSEPEVLNRPQEPKPPFPYREEEVSFENREAGFFLSGTLTIPPGEGPFPAVVLITGSGSQNRDEEIFGHKPFRLIADQLTRKGIAVLRYDDRGFASSGGVAAGATSEDFAGDARSAIEYISGRPETNPSKTGIIGHSEGGMIAFMLASEYDDIGFVISLAGPGVDGKTILLDQSEYMGRLMGAEEAVLKENRVIMDKVYEVMISTESYEAWGEEVLEFISAHYAAKGDLQLSEGEIEQVGKNLLGSIPESSYNWLRYFVMFDPSEYLVNIKCPVLALNGEKDCQVLANKNINAIRDHLMRSGNMRVVAVVLPGLNHLFQNCDTGLPAEYGQIEETFNPKALNIMMDWILQL